MFHTQSRTGRTRATAVRQTAQKALAAEEAAVKVRYGCLTWQMREARHLSYAWGLKCVHPAQKACKLMRFNSAGHAPLVPTQGRKIHFLGKFIFWENVF